MSNENQHVNYAGRDKDGNLAYPKLYEVTSLGKTVDVLPTLEQAKNSALKTVSGGLVWELDQTTQQKVIVGAWRKS